jgi:hypothetical protein
VNSQPIYAVVRDGRLSGQLTTSDTVTQYGRGFSNFATGVFGTPTAVPAGGAGVYRSARFTPSSITATSYSLVMNAASAVGHGGDSGGPTVVTVNGVGVGIAGVRSTCTPTAYIPGAPANWSWATGISACQYVSTEPFLGEIPREIQESPILFASLYQRHVDGRIWKYDGAGRCTATACPGWIEIDRNPATRDLAAARGSIAIQGRRPSWAWTSF